MGTTTTEGLRLLKALADDDWDAASTIVEDWVQTHQLHHDGKTHGGYPYINMEGYDWVNCEDGWYALDAWLAVIVYTMSEDDVVIAWAAVTRQYVKMLSNTREWMDAQFFGGHP